MTCLFHLSLLTYHILKLSTELRFQVADQVLAKVGLEGRGDFEALDDSATGKDLDDCLLVGAEAFHCLSQDTSIFIWIEWIGGENGWFALHTREGERRENFHFITIYISWC
jgi:hypothetical protein